MNRPQSTLTNRPPTRHRIGPRRGLRPFESIVLALVLCVGLGRSSAQDPETNPPPNPPQATLIIQGPNGPIKITATGSIQLSPPPAPTKPDAFDLAVASAASRRRAPWVMR